MNTLQVTTDTIVLPDAPAIPGLSFRCFRGESDYPKMLAVVLASSQADQIERADTLEDITRNYSHLVNCDPYQDLIMAEINDEPVGYCRVWWLDVIEGQRVYLSIGFLLSPWRRKGVGRAMLRWAESRLRDIAAGHPADRPRLFGADSGSTQPGLIALLESEGYQPVTYGAIMVRPDLTSIPDAPMPAGLEVRPAQPEHFRQIWEASHEAFHDHWGYSPDDYPYAAFVDEAKDPSLWRVAWEGDQVAGMVLGFINAEENAMFNRLRGWTEGISVRRPWRRRGLARALLVQSLHAMKERGMTEAALGVHTENPNGAYHLYESVGFRVVRSDTIYRKPMK